MPSRSGPPRAGVPGGQPAGGQPRPAQDPGRFATEVITRDVAPQLQIHYKSSKAKAYLKEGRALRVEATVNDAGDFDLRKTLNVENWRALRRLGADTNSRFLAALGEGQPGLPDPATLESVVLPSVVDGQRAPGLRFGDPRTMALLASIASFAHVMGGLTNKGLRAHMTSTVAPRLPPGASHLRSAPPAPQRLHRAHPGHPHLPGHSPRPQNRRLLHTTRRPGHHPSPHRPGLPQPTTTTSAAPAHQRWRTYERELTNLLRTTNLAA